MTRRTARQIANYAIARRRLEDEIILFVKTVRRSRFQVRSVAWNYRRIYELGDTRTNLSVTLFGVYGLVSREPEPGCELPKPRLDPREKRRRRKQRP